jgi:hypothetical protein
MNIESSLLILRLDFDEDDGALSEKRGMGFKGKDTI